MPLAYCERGMTYLNFEKYDEALVDLSKAIELKLDYGKVLCIGFVEKSKG